MSKPVTAMAVLQLVQEGKIDLDADVNNYLKRWKNARELVVYVWSLELAKGLGAALRTRRAVPAAEPL